jgi:hypothetical protein
MEPRLSQNGHEDAAAEVFERVLAAMEGTPAAPSSNGHGTKESRVRLTQVRSAAARTLDLYGELFQRAFETYADLAQAALAPGTDPAPDAPLTLAGRPGEAASAPLWLHNLSETAVTGVDLFLTDLRSGSGERIEGATFAPPVADIAAGASACVTLNVAIPRGVAGLFFGHVLSRALPAVGLPVRLEVG